MMSIVIPIAISPSSGMVFSITKRFSWERNCPFATEKIVRRAAVKRTMLTSLWRTIRLKSSRPTGFVT